MTRPQPRMGRRKVAPPDALVEALAAIEHEQWSLWAEHMLAHATPASIRRWRRQIATPYAALSETEKEKDRVFARKVLTAVAGYLATRSAAALE